MRDASYFHMRIFGPVLTLLLICSVMPVALCQEKNAACLECHDEPPLNGEKSYKDTLFLSAHSALSCLDCHRSADAFPHEDLPPVSCGDCHDREVRSYEWHGRLPVPDGDDVPTCADCHGKHDILYSGHINSRVNPLNLSKTCGHCHEDLDLIRKHKPLHVDTVPTLRSSIHGISSMGTRQPVVGCTECHGSEGSAHRILAPGNPESSLNFFSIPETCGRCHEEIEDDYWDGIHGMIVAGGETSAPVCTHCHGEHGILPTSDPRSPVNPSRLVEATCSPCHESAYLNEKYGIPPGRPQTWFDSYHGIKSSAGDITVANCSSCHGSHRILPSTDPTSSIHRTNLATTCGNCHPGISPLLASTPIHQRPGTYRTPLAGIIARIYTAAIAIIITMMVLHWLLDLQKKIRLLNQKPQVVRMNRNELCQHSVLMISFFVLAVTGFSLRFADAFWVQWFFGWEGGFSMRGTIHRIAAVVFILTVFWHLFYLFSDRGRQYLRDISPRLRDFRHLAQTLAYNLGSGKEGPRCGRFGYVEKIEYWGLVFGTAVMTASGFFLWLDNTAVHWFSEAWLDVMLVFHYYEAWLAVLTVVVWHLYSTLLKPRTSPMNPAWLTGKVPVEMYQSEHSDDPTVDSQR